MYHILEKVQINLKRKEWRMMANRIILIIAAIILPVVTILINSDVVVAQFFIDFSTKLIREQSNVTIISMSNVGQFQADNVIFTLHLNNTVDGFLDMCPEGNMYRLHDKILVAEFQRMSPQMICLFELIVSGPVQLDVALAASDHRSIWISGLPFPPSTFLAMFLLLTVEIILLALIILSFMPKIFQHIDFLRVPTNIHQLELEPKICKFVLYEYGVKIRNVDAYILKLIYLEKTTMNQLKAYSKLSKWHINYRIWKMRELELISKEKLVLDTTLNKHFESYRKYFAS